LTALGDLPSLPLLDDLTRGGWILSSKLVDASGAAVARPSCNPKAPDCTPAADLFQRVLYQPDGRFWLFQWIESAIFVGMSLILLGAVTWWVSRRLT
jgi:hypothetical protein